MVGQRVSAFKNNLNFKSFDMPDVTNVFGLEPEKLKIGMLTVTKRVLDIADVDIEEMSAELMEISPMAYVIYYEECSTRSRIASER